MTVKPGWARKKDRLRRREAEALRPGRARPLWVLSPAERRLLAITFIGGLGSIVGGASVIGGAFALDRYLRTFPLWEWVVLAVTLPIMGFTLWVFSAFWSGMADLRPFREDPDLRALIRYIQIMFRIILVACVLLATMAWLVLIGAAAGIKPPQ